MTKVSFKIENNADLNDLFTLEKQLLRKGISFDTDYWTQEAIREWNLDWSLEGATAKSVLKLAKKINPRLMEIAKVE